MPPPQAGTPERSHRMQQFQIFPFYFYGLLNQAERRRLAPALQPLVTSTVLTPALHPGEGLVPDYENFARKDISMQLILASASPRRRELLGLFQIPFAIRAADIDETMDPAKAPFDEVARVSRAKALAVPRAETDIVIAADTIVVCGGKVLGKPHSEAEAADMLTLLSGRDHQVMTGCTVLRGDRCETFTEVTDLHFRPLSQKEIEKYVATGEPMDKAGAYGIQGGAALFCERMAGDYYNVMGLPVCRLGQTLRAVAPEVMEDTL